MAIDLLAEIKRLERNPTPEETKVDLLHLVPELNDQIELLDKLVSFVQEQNYLAYTLGYLKGNAAGSDGAMATLARVSGLKR